MKINESQQKAPETLAGEAIGAHHLDDGADPQRLCARVPEDQQRPSGSEGADGEDPRGQATVHTIASQVLNRNAKKSLKDP